MMNDVMSFWWENITGPQMLIDKIALCLSEGKNVVLELEESLPWQEQMRDLVMYRLDGVHPDWMEWEGVKGQGEIVPKLLQNFHRNKLNICPTEYSAQLEYLKKEGIFRDTVVWLTFVGDADPLQLVRFLSDYRGEGLEKQGVFLAEIITGQHLPKLSGSMEVIRGKDYMRCGDILLYSNILADGKRKFPEELKNYIAHVAANLAGQDVELIPGILEEINFENEDPVEALHRLWEQGYPACSGHVPTREEISRRVWKAQLQSAFAGIEMERLRITEEYANDIEEAIGTEYWDSKWNRSGYITQHGEEIESASDVELGTMVRMMSLRRNDDRGRYLLYFPDDQLRNWIVFLTDCRNNLAHHKVCTPEQICRLLRMRE